MDTLIGKFTLTPNQLNNLALTDLTPFKGFHFNHETTDLTAVSVDDPTQPQIDALTAIINAAPEQLSKAASAQAFNCDVCKQALYAAFLSNPTVLMQYTGIVNPLIDFKAFEGLKNILNTLSPTDAATAKAVFLAQGVDLDTY